MRTSLEPNKKRVKQRRREVMEAAYRARTLSPELLTEEVSNFIKFALSLQKTKIVDNTSKDDNVE